MRQPLRLAIAAEAKPLPDTILRDAIAPAGLQQRERTADMADDGTPTAIGNRDSSVTMTSFNRATLPTQTAAR